MNKRTQDVMFSSKSSEWQTPIELFRRLDEKYHFTLDPCTTNANPLGTPKYYTKEDNGLNKSWKDEIVFVNPPYSDIEEWVRKCHDEGTSAKTIVMLIPVRTDTKWFHNFILHDGDIQFIKGRIRFGNPLIEWKDGIVKKTYPAPFPSMFVRFPRMVGDIIDLTKGLK